MEKMIGQLFEIEEKANQIIARANEQKSRLLEDFDRDVAEMEKNIATKTTEKLRFLQEQINDEPDKFDIYKTMIDTFYNRIIEKNA